MSKRRSILAAFVGVALILLAFLIVALVIWAKPTFGWLVGPPFLPSVVILVVVGALAVLGSLWGLRGSALGWGGWFVGVWALIALASPLAGIMFLGPWAVLLVSAPVVLWLLARWLRATPR
jgi:hypothetical protein